MTTFEQTVVLLARATATYVAADAARKAELQARYRFRLPPATGKPTPRGSGA